jgi:acetyl-CoA/propionyl-CoA carboxylase biotin carboxyl carrier protein
VETLRWPSGDGIRIDAGIDVGTEVGGRFDPMLAKIVAHGRDRTEALDRLGDALDATLVLGLVTNLRFLRWLVRQPVVRTGEARIDTLERIWPPDGWSDPAAIPDDAWQAAARALGAGGWRLNGRPVVRLEAEGTERSVTVEADPRGSSAAGVVVAGDTAHVDVEGRSVAIRRAPAPDVDRAARSAAAHHHGGGPVDVEAPMPGRVLAVHLGVGLIVEPGDPIATLEAMKMEHVVAATTGGRIAAVHVAPGDQLSRGQALATIDA